MSFDFLQLTFVNLTFSILTFCPVILKNVNRMKAVEQVFFKTQYKYYYILKK